MRSQQQGTGRYPVIYRQLGNERPVSEVFWSVPDKQPMHLVGCDCENPPVLCLVYGAFERQWDDGDPYLLGSVTKRFKVH